MECLTQREQERFWSRVTKSDGCWLWNGATNDSGYGSMSVKRNGRWGHERAHRLSIEYATGESACGRWVLHKCDVRHCVNPAHLYFGSPAENSADMLSRDRHRLDVRRGEAHGCHKLTATEVAEMRRLYAAGVGTPTLGRMFSVSTSQAWNVVTRHHWKEVA